MVTSNFWIYERGCISQHNRLQPLNGGGGGAMGAPTNWRVSESYKGGQSRFWTVLDMVNSSWKSKSAPQMGGVRLTCVPVTQHQANLRHGPVRPCVRCWRLTYKRSREMCDTASVRRIARFIEPLYHRSLRQHHLHLTWILQEQGLFEVEQQRKGERSRRKGDYMQRCPQGLEGIFAPLVSSLLI